MAETFGQRLRRLRRERGMQQADLAGEGISVSYISMLENGNRTVTARVLTQLAGRLGVDEQVLAGPVPHALLGSAQRLELAGAEMQLAHGDFEAALEHFTRMEPAVGAAATWGAVRCLEGLGRLNEAIAAIDRLVASSETDPTVAVRAMMVRVRCLSEGGDETQALVAARAAADTAAAAGLHGTDEHIQALSTLVGQLYAVGMHADAEVAARDLLALVDAGGSWKARGSAYWNAAGVAEARGDLDLAVAYSQRALAVLSEGDDERSWARCAVASAWFSMRGSGPVEHLPGVHRTLARAAEVLSICGTALDLAYLETEQARAHLLSGDALQARKLAASALARLGADQRSERATTLLVMAEALVRLGDEAATATAEQLELTLLTLPRSRMATLTWRGLADVWKTLGSSERAYRALEEALNSQAISASPGSDAPSTAERTVTT